jgi:drug/metabolite transporter (DMT)-like permease
VLYNATMPVVSESTSSQHFPDSRRGAILMLAAVAAFSVMDALLKALAARYPIAQVTGLRGLASLPFILAVYAAQGKLRLLRMQTPRLHLLRGMLGIGMMFTFVYAVRHQSLTGVYAVYMIAPVLIVALAAGFLHEKTGAGNWIAVLVGLAGVWIILSPSANDFERGASIAALISSLAYALAVLTSRRLTRTDTSESMIFSFLAILGLGGCLIALPGWQPVAAADLLLLSGVGMVGATAQHCITDAFRYAAASTLAPIEYTALLWALGIDWLVWNTTPTATMLLGAALVVAAGLHVVRGSR